jgi:hypothetical protein
LRQHCSKKRTLSREELDGLTGRSVDDVEINAPFLAMDTRDAAWGSMSSDPNAQQNAEAQKLVAAGHERELRHSRLAVYHSNRFRRIDNNFPSTVARAYGSVRFSTTNSARSRSCTDVSARPQRAQKQPASVHVQHLDLITLELMSRDRCAFFCGSIRLSGLADGRGASAVGDIIRGQLIHREFKEMIQKAETVSRA